MAAFWRVESRSRWDLSRQVEVQFENGVFEVSFLTVGYLKSPNFDAFKTYDRLLMVDATQRKVVLATNGMKTNRDLEQMVEDVLLGDLRVPSVKIVDGNAASVLAHGKAHGLVVDCGFWETSCVPVSWLASDVLDEALNLSNLAWLRTQVYDYTPLFSYATCVSLGGNAVNQELAAVRDPPGHPMAADSLKFSIIADPDSTEQQDVAFNVLFKGDEDGRSITDAILSTLLEVGPPSGGQAASRRVLINCAPNSARSIYENR